MEPGKPYIPVVDLNPVQTQAAGLTESESAKAYLAVTERFRLRGRQRSRLDRCVQYSVILNAAHRRDWKACERALGHAHIIE